MNGPQEINEEAQIRMNTEMNLQRQIGAIGMMNAKLQARCDVLTAKNMAIGQAHVILQGENEKLKKEIEELKKPKTEEAPPLPELSNAGRAASLGTQPPHPAVDAK